MFSNTNNFNIFGDKIMFVMGAGARGLQVENEPVQGTVNKMDWGQVGGGGGTGP